MSPLSNTGSASFAIAIGFTEIRSATVGEILTALQQDDDPDGNPSTDFIYTWESSPDGNNWSPILVAKTLTINQTLEGQKIRLIVTYFDQKGHYESITTGEVLISSIPSIPFLALTRDTGIYDWDRNTRNPFILISGLQEGATWQFSTDSGSTWNNGSGSSFTVSPGTYTRGQVQVRQTDTAGNTSDPNTSFAAFTVDTTAPISPSLALAADTGLGKSDRITKNRSILVSGLENDASWQFSTNSGSTWNNGSGSSFTVSPGTYTRGQVRVRQTDIAGNTSPQNTSFASFTVDTTAPKAPTLIRKGRTVFVTGLEHINALQYSTNRGRNWKRVTGSRFNVPLGKYVNGEVRARQIDLAGNISKSKIMPAFTTTQLNIPTLALAEDTGVDHSDRITNNPSIRVSDLANRASWQYSTDRGVTWTNGSGTSFRVAPGSYARGQVQVRQSIDKITSLHNKSFAGFSIDTTAPRLRFISAGIWSNSRFQINGSNEGRKIEGTGADPKQKVELFFNQANKNRLGQRVAGTNSNQKGEFNFKLSARNIQLIGQGQRSLQLLQIDLAGNIGRAATFATVNSTSATRMRDRLTGIDGKEDLFTLSSPQDSLLYGNTGAMLLPPEERKFGYDTITNFEKDDRLRIEGLSYRTVIRREKLWDIPKLNPQHLAALKLKPVEAAAFVVRGMDGTFIALNGRLGGFSAEGTAILFLKNFSLDGSSTVTVI